MKVLLHACCGPCTAFPLAQLRNEAHDVTGFFFNPNIHPWREYWRRARTMEQYAGLVSLPLQWDTGYDLAGYLTAALETPGRPERCRRCYHLRLGRTARAARAGGFDGFSTTLLVSPFQHHQLVQEAGREAAREHGVEFLYQDFRPGYREGIDMAKQAKLYRQPYCGCIFSELERFAPGRDHV
ncbi:MAG: epoxyqueuosine reductase QueH [Bacillota bacterium]